MNYISYYYKTLIWCQRTPRYALQKNLLHQQNPNLILFPIMAGKKKRISSLLKYSLLFVIPFPFYYLFLILQYLFLLWSRFTPNKIIIILIIIKEKIACVTVVTVPMIRMSLSYCHMFTWYLSVFLFFSTFLPLNFSLFLL